VAARNSELTATSDRVLAITRIFDAPRDLVFKAWTDPEHVKRWWAPKGFTVVSLEMDLRLGGAYTRHMRSLEGSDSWRRGVYKEIVAPERLAFTYISDNTQGTVGHETLVTVNFEDLGARTKMTFRQAVFESVLARDVHRGGWTSTMERFSEYLAEVLAA